MDAIWAIGPLVAAMILDWSIGDPEGWPHPIVWMGQAISACEHCFNHGQHRKAKGAVCAVGLIAIAGALAWLVVWTAELLGEWVKFGVETILIFYCLAGTTLIREVRGVFRAADLGLEQGRKQVGRIVGRDTASLSDHEVRTAALETLAENLSDGVIAPLFWFALLGVPGMVAYKMVNTLDSMIGYRNERYREFGSWAARIDDAANYIPARLTALLMVLVSGRWGLLSFVHRYGREHLSPNSGYPEAALAGILDCRFGGPHDYFGELVPKPYIGSNERALVSADIKTAVYVNRAAELVMIILTAACRLLI
ncbi:MAG: adenosylcobinamide-phosphate synthase CbiB [Bacteroidales bacterium]|nr:adenosylcobinamide-phosphate synthase CbiB [Bacteroidales bacterium]